MPVIQKTGGALLVFALVALVSIFLRPLLPIDETRYVAVAWEMFQSGDFFVPTKNFELYTHKPPLLFWSINLVWAIFGVSELGARLVGLGFALLALYLTARLAKQMWPQEGDIAQRSAWILAGSLAFVVFSSATMFDAALTVGVLLGMMSLLAAARTGQWRYWLAFGTALAIGTLAKGPVIFIHLLPAALSMPLWGRQITSTTSPITLQRTAFGIGIAIIAGLAIVLAWLLPAIIQGGEEYRNAILWDQSAGRIVQSFAHSRPVCWYLMALPLLLFPWVWVPQFWRAIWRSSWSEPQVRLLVIWMLSALALFSLIDGKQLHYLVPELPAFALLIARIRPPHGSGRVWLATLPIVGLAIAFTLAGLGVIDAQQITPLLTPNITLLAVGLGLLAACGLAFNASLIAGGAILSFGLVLCIGVGVRFTDVYAANDTHEIGQIITQYEDEGIAFFESVNRHAEFNFAARMTRPFALLHSEDDVLNWRADHPRGVFISRLDQFQLPEKPWKFMIFRGHPYGIYRLSHPITQESL